MPNIKYETTIPFQGFYGSIHENEVDWTIEQEIQNLQDEYKKTDKQIEDWLDAVEYKKIFKAYAQHYVNCINQELDIPSLDFKELNSPKFYNYETDRIFCTLEETDLVQIHKKIINTSDFKKLVSDTFTPRDGFSPSYSNDVIDWIRKPVKSLDHNEIGLLIECYFNMELLSEIDMLDCSTPMHEIIYDELPMIRID
tara:strand:- start:784 stop:1374 length:591 start_codon:yes stop_codon:yes gene_type:complete